MELRIGGEISVDKNEVAYIAGFFDGEGTINLQTHHRNNAAKTTTFHLKFRITNTNKEILDFIKFFFGVGKIYEMKRYSLKHKVAWSYELNGHDAAFAIKILLPYLVVKKEQAKLALKFAATLGPRYAAKKLDVEVVEFRLGIGNRISELNHT